MSYSNDPLGAEFARDTGVIREAMLSQSGKKNKELTLITITLKRTEGGFLGTIMAGKGGLFNKSKKEFSNTSLDILMRDLAVAAKKGFGLTQRGTGYGYSQPSQPRYSEPQRQREARGEYGEDPYAEIMRRLDAIENKRTQPQSQRERRVEPVSQPVEEVTKCAKCGTEVSWMKFCPDCGIQAPAKPKPKTAFCGNCGTASTGSRFCTTCGTKFD
jgi:ribosomal protein L32